MALAAIGIAALLGATSVLTPFENWSMDRRLSLRGERAPNSDVVVVAINQPSLDTLGERWPISRRHYAKLIDGLSDAGAKAIAFTLEFDAETKPEDDMPMMESMRRAGNVVLAASSASRNGETLILGGAQARETARVRVGMTTSPADSDKTYRHFEWTVQGLPTLPLEVSRRLGRRPDRSAFHDGRAWIDVRGRPCVPDRPLTCAIPTYGFSDVLSMSASRARRLFAGKIVVVGATASGASSPLAVWSPGPDLTSKPHLIALEVATVLDGFPLRQASWLLGALLLVVAGFLPVALDGLGRWALSMRGRAGNALNGWFGALLTGVFGVLGVILISGIAVLAFDLGTVIPIGAPLLAAFLVTSFGVVYRYRADTRNAQRLYAAADSVVPKEYVGELLARCENPSHDTTKIEKEGTLLFVDIAGFTVITTALMKQPGEKTPTERTMDVLNLAAKFQDLVVEAVFDNGGVVVDIMGDGVLAAFGLIGRSAKHRDLALRTAHIACTDVVLSMRQWLDEEGWGDLVAKHRETYEEPTGTDDFDVRAGLDSGEVAVGLTGHDGGLEFSVIAEPTIIAARLQAEAGELHVTLCASARVFEKGVSADTLQRVPAEPWFEPLQLKGQAGIDTYVYTWTRDDALYGLVSRKADPV